MERSLESNVKIVEMVNCHHLQIGLKIVPLVTENERPISLLLVVVFRERVKLED